MSEPEEVLTGGNINNVVKVRETVRRKIFLMLMGYKCLLILSSG